MSTELEKIIGQGYIKTNCPHPDHEDTDPSYVIYPTHGYCFGCGFRETPEQIMKRTGGKFDEGTRRRRRTSDNPVLDLEGHIRFWNLTLTVGPRKDRVSYLWGRGIGQRAIETFALGHSGDHFVIPIWYEGRITGFKKRSDPKYCDPDAPKYLNQKGSGSLFTTFERPTDVLIITEGEFDAIVLSQYGYSAITATVGSTGLAESMGTVRAVQTVRSVYACTDMDDAGDNAYEQLKRLRPDIKRMVWEEANDISEFLCRIDDGSRGEALRTIMRKADLHARPDSAENRGI